MQENDSRRKNASAHNVTGGLIVLGVGVIFLLINLDVIPPLHKTWPLFPIVVGVALIIPRMIR